MIEEWEDRGTRPLYSIDVCQHEEAKRERDKLTDLTARHVTG